MKRPDCPDPCRGVQALALACALGAGSGALAWGPAGHATIGTIADRLLAGTHAEAEVRRLLASSGAAAARGPVRVDSLRVAGVWADCAKAVRPDGDRFVYADAGRFPECQPFETPAGQARSIAWVRANWDGCHPGLGDDPCHRQYHYTDVAIQHARYGREHAGTSDHDVVAAIAACIAVLQGRPAPAPFRFLDRTDALLLLAHLVGDVHQPLHVGAVYLDGDGRPVDPDAAPADRQTHTVGGNRLDDHGTPLHRGWDEVGPSLGPDSVGRETVASAQAVAPSAGPPADWAAAWATDTLSASRAAFDGLQFGPAAGLPRHWPVVLPPGHAATREALQRAQLVKAGARLAQVLRAIWP